MNYSNNNTNINNNFNNHNNINLNNNLNNVINQTHFPINNINYNINNNITPSIQTQNIINNVQHNQNNIFQRQNTTSITQTPNIQSILPYQNNNNNNNINSIQLNNNNIPYKKSKSSNINSSDFWQRIDSRKERQMNNESSLNRNQNENMRAQALNSIMNENNHHRNERNMESMNEIFEDFFGDFFNETPHTRIEISSSNSPHIFFHNFFSPFGIRENDFSQNYFSNFNRNFFTDFVSLIEANQRGGRNAHPPASQEALKKLKRFPLEERFCKKKDGKVELPNCCICQCEIELGNETVLVLLFHEHEEVVAAESCDEFVFVDVLQDLADEHSECHVAHLVAQGLVHVLKILQVDEYRRVVLERIANVLLVEHEDARLVVGAGHRVGDGCLAGVAHEPCSSGQNKEVPA
jgi:hypothetical protein